ncbi:hypothetical protein TSUD_377030 [Trifolium subterraneum]|uniref:RNase H type-1 domain-containing protein n=1 Tax=Trifolium subterraneum TaxID=3900 RepID=A0A2Z6LU34_TRISU|nr:hypothetical protein TSUD_377030 [Trifolium subterraneum]
MLVWILWNNRNSRVWNNTKEPGQQLGVKSVCMWNEWEVVQTVRNNTAQSAQALQIQRVQQLEKWQKPRHGRLKCNVDAGFHNGIGKTCNVDAGFHNGKGKTSAGWCVRDHMGQFVIAGTSWIQGKYSTIEASRYQDKKQHPN